MSVGNGYMSSNGTQVVVEVYTSLAVLCCSLLLASVLSSLIEISPCVNAIHQQSIKALLLCSPAFGLVTIFSAFGMFWS